PASARDAADEPRPRGRSPLPLQLAATCGVTLRWPDDAALAPAPPPPAAGAPIVLAPGSGGRAKCWPRTHWLQLAAGLAAAGRALAVLVGPVEAERDDPRAWPWPTAVSFLADLPLPVVAARLAAAAVFVGNDSGTTHLAAMLGAPTVALFGPTDPAVWAPTGPRVRVLGGGDPTAVVDVAAVGAAVLALG
ncbi:MAG: glycosyltransferase family 9 protein, partial [Planctomycetota bacterium]